MEPVTQFAVQPVRAGDSAPSRPRTLGPVALDLTDPIMRLLPDERPQAFDLLDPKNQKVRGRYFLMTWAYTGSEPYSWFMALQVEPDNIKAIADLVAATPDERIAQAVRWRLDDQADGASA